MMSSVDRGLEVPGYCEGISLTPFTSDALFQLKQHIMEVDGGK